MSPHGVSFATPPQSSSTTYSPSPKRFAFTPRHTIKAPRAWERKPATPFAPRNESQKIWKRPAAHPLSMKGIGETGACHSRGARAVKRMRISKDAHDVWDGVSTSWAEDELWSEDELEARHKLPQAPERLPMPIATGSSLAINTPGTDAHPPLVTGDDQELPQSELLPIGKQVAAEDTSSADSASGIATPPSSVDAIPYVEQQMGKRNGVNPESIFPDETLDKEVSAQLQSALKIETEINEGCQVGAVDQLTEDGLQDADQNEFEAIEGLATELAQEDQPAEVTDSLASASGSEHDATEHVQEPHSGTEMTDPVKVDIQQVAQSLPAHASSGHGEDAAFLHAFLSRTKAQKEARAVSPQKDSSAGSPVTRSRAALTSLSTNSASPKRPKRTRKGRVDEGDHDELSASPYTQAIEAVPTSPPRRSGRTKLPLPQKPPTVNPSTIPVRRANGTEFVFLQRTEPQQIALATRSNTRRNKGEAVMPKYKLKALSEVQRSPSKSPKKREGRGVSFKEEPCYFDPHPDEQDVEEVAENTDEKPKARKSRRLGASNGTPAPKKVMAESAMQLDTPKPRSRRKAQK